MSPSPNDIYVATIRWRNCNDPRPCIIVKIISPCLFVVVPLSSQTDLFKENSEHFLIDEHHPDFPATGLLRTSYADLSMQMEIRAQALRKKRIGYLSGQLARDFAKLL